MRARAAERERFKRRLTAQYAVGRVLGGAGDLDEAGTEIFAILAKELGWQLGVLWNLDEGSKVLRFGGARHATGDNSPGFEERYLRQTFARGDGTTGGGLRSMKESATLLGGNLRLLPRPGGGTRVEVMVPLEGSGQPPAVSKNKKPEADG